MYKLLIVDDEAFIVEGLKILFEDDKKYSYDIYSAKSGKQALSILEHTRIDVVVTDIRMFGMDGIELSTIIKQKWPLCRIVVLSGYSDSEYVLSAINSGVDSYILKSESNAKLIEAVYKCIDAIEKENSNEIIQSLAKKCLEESLPILRNNLIKNLINGTITAEETYKKINEYNINLSMDRKVILVGSRIDDDGKQAFNAPTIVDSVFTRYIDSKAESVFYNSNPRYIIWIVQPKDNNSTVEESDFIDFLTNTFDLIQQQCLSSFDISISILCGQKYISWADIPLSYKNMIGLLNYQLNPDEKLIIANEKYLASKESSSLLIKNNINKLKMAVEYGQENEFDNIITEIYNSISFDERDISSLELYFGLCYAFINYLHISNREDEFENIFGNISTMFQYIPKKEEIIEKTTSIKKWIFQGKTIIRDKRNSEIIYRINKYVEDNISEDLSLSSLSKVVYLNPVYLSRLYKQITGTNISEYILSRRIEHAKQLLIENRQKINEIAHNSGFESPAHFTRVFKKYTKLTPQEYRNR